MTSEGRAATDANPLLRALWAASTPATLQDADERLIDANEAYLELVGRPHSTLTGRDVLAWTPAEDHSAIVAARTESRAALAAGQARPAQLPRRLLDAQGRERWTVVTVIELPATEGAPLCLVLWHEISAEVAARAQARRAEDELAQWFDLSGTGMLVYDDQRLIVRCNRALESLIDQVPEVLADAAPELQLLLGWQGQAPEASLTVGAPPIEREAVLMRPGQSRGRRLSARLACHAGEDGARRVMAVVQDRSAEDERDLAQLEMSMLMDTASIGVATYDPAQGWLAPRRSGHAATAAKSQERNAAVALLQERNVSAAAGRQRNVSAAPERERNVSAAPERERRASGALLGIGREIVEADSLPEFERLQRALRSGERAEVRYAVRHPELGARWLLTRVEPGALAGGRNTTSVVTLDVTEQERATRRNEQLLREMTTILESSTAGIAYLRGPVLVRCNRRFERMLGYAPGAAAGASLQEIFGRSVGGPEGAREAIQALSENRLFEAELPLPHGDGPPLWYSLSVRRAQPESEHPEAVAVLTDITRLKTQQAELQQSLRDRELMFSLSEVGIVYQRGARIERANQAMAQLTGWASPELSTLDAAALYEDTRACVDFEALIAQGLRERGRFSGERKLRRRDGSLAWVQVAVRQVQRDAPEAGVICSFVDIDERRRARETLARQVERTRSILDSVLVGIVTVSAQGIQWMNRSARRMFGGELVDFVGQPVSTVATPEPDHPLRRSGLLQQLEEGQSETFECRLKGRDGREFWVVGNAVLSGQAADGGREMTIALLDIERRRQAEVRIAQAQASLQRVIDKAPLAIALFDAGTLRVQQLNQTAAEFFGCALEDVIGATPEECAAAPLAAALQQWLGAARGAAALPPAMPEERSTDAADALSDRAAAEAGSSHEWRDDSAVRPGAAESPRIWDCRITPLDKEGTARSAQLLLVASDVTVQRAAERARLQAAIDQREVLVREVHHRIKNNLQGVAGLLQQNVARHPALASVLTEAVGQVQAIAQVYGLQVGATGPLRVARLLTAIAASVQRTFGREIVVETVGQVPHLLPEAEAIPVALTVNELLTNAIKHGSGTGAVRCQLAAKGAGVEVRIASQATLPAGFDLAAVRGGVSGLGLVRALLPRRHATLSLLERGSEVVATIELRAPGVQLPAADDAGQSDV